MNFYISDLHLGHKNAIVFDKRPFLNLKDMEETIIKNWNSVVNKSDNVYILGDMFWHNEIAPNILKQLNGNKFLITGNHDRVNSEMSKYFVWQKEYAEIVDGDKNVVLCHYPIPCFKNHYYGWVHLHGHVHGGFEQNMMKHIKDEMVALYDVPCEMYNVGCMMNYMGYTPKTLEQILGANK